MCLQYVKPIRRGEEEGWAFKEFVWLGGTSLSTPYTKFPMKLGKTVTDPHGFSITCWSHYDNSILPVYEAGFHLYKKFGIPEIRYLDQSPIENPVIVLCYYRRAIAQDDRDIVAKEITPYIIIKRGSC